jgi:2-haloacid dehalogenase
MDGVEALSFDCYGTLIDWEAGISAVLTPWAIAHGLSLDADELLARYGTREAEAELRHPTELYPDILARSFRDLGQELGAGVTEDDAEALARSVPDWPAFDDSAEALTRLRRRFSLIILSNVDRKSFAASNERLGVTFDSIITAEDVGSYKPQQRNFDALLQEASRLGIREGALMHVAQSLFHDHVPAKRAGLPTVWVNRRQNRPGWGATPAPPAPVEPDWEYASLAAFADAVSAGVAR